ncbi:MAG TPA: nuclear transport factor 2 family protein [Gaiellaceae bacterium]|nr:nuclear transport factor 2 family protein [Gaiellaceae bacterium]
MTSRNMQTYLRLIGQAGWGRHELGDYLADDASNDAVFEAYTDDVVVVEPECLPQGGEHHGREAWRAMHAGIQDLWEQQFEILDLWDVPDDDVIVLHASMVWTGKATGRTATVPFIGVLTFRDALIARVEIYPRDSKAILDTLAPVDGDEQAAAT